MKKLVAISLFIFWAVVTAILTAGLVFYQKQQPAASPNNSLTTQNSKNQATNLNKVSGENLTLTIEEVAKHNSVADCWLIIQDKVYDVSSYINFHPGNPETIIPYCGKEATTAFETKNKNKPHSQEAWNLLRNYYIGDLNQPLTNQNLKESSQKIQSSGLNLLTEKIFKESPGGEIKKVKPKKDGGYDVDLIYNGVIYKIKVDSTLNIIKKEIKMED
jgi:cytochrome b involved in lipid metabolism